MKEWLIKAKTSLIRKRYALFKTLTIGLLVLILTACGGKAASQDVSIQLSEKPVQQKNGQLSGKISEVAPPEVIQKLDQTLEVYQPQVKIINPQPDSVLQTNKLTVSFEVQDLPIFKNAQYGLGSHLKVILDNQPELEVYDLSQPLELSDLSAGTHTLRVFASRPWHESFKNEGAYAQTKFHVFTKSDDNNPDPNLPILTYNHPQGSYGEEPILLDFYLTNAPLHILAKDNPDNAIADWRIRCTINGESFIIDRWQSLYLKGFNSGQNWVKLEFLDNQGNPVKNVFNSTVKIINYEPKGKDTLAKIIRGELSFEDVRGIVDSDYAVKIPREVIPDSQLKEKSDNRGFFDRFNRGKLDKTPTPQPTVEAIPEGIETPQPETQSTLEKTIPEVIETPQPLLEKTPEIIESPTSEVTPESQRKEIDRDVKPKVETTPELPPTLPEIIEPLENQPPITQQDITEPKVEVTPSEKQSTTKRLSEDFNLPRAKTPAKTPEISLEVEEVK